MKILNSNTIVAMTLLLIIQLTHINYVNASQSQQVKKQQSASTLFLLINKRLSYMEDVALYKAQKQLPIENIKREQQVLAKAMASAATQDLDPKLIEVFFRAQIDSAKAIQYRYRAELLTEAIEKLPPDLSKEIRPQLLRLGDEIIGQIATHIREHGQLERSLMPMFYTLLHQKYLSDRDKQQLFKGLSQIKLSNNND
jgi:chorismate mutase